MKENENVVRENIIKDVGEVICSIKHIPSMREYEKIGKFNHGTIVKIFGKWNKFLIDNFGGIYSIPKKEPRKVLCLCCRKETVNPKFCSQSCAAIYNNTAFPKRKRSHKTKYLCPSCKKELVIKESKRCIRCQMKYFLDQFEQKILGNFKSTFARHKYQAIRNSANRKAKFYKLERKCNVCGYNTHVDLCHIKSIGDFDKSSKVSEVNSLDNLVFLCKNHHWELDHGRLQLDKSKILHMDSEHNECISLSTFSVETKL